MVHQLAACELHRLVFEQLRLGRLGLHKHRNWNLSLLIDYCLSGGVQKLQVDNVRIDARGDFGFGFLASASVPTDFLVVMLLVLANFRSTRKFFMKVLNSFTAHNPSLRFIIM